MVGAITQVWTEIMTWITTALGSIQDVFYTAGATADDPGSLTFLGILAVAGVAIAISLLIIRLLQNFLRLRS